jgi:hypothetical protein
MKRILLIAGLMMLWFAAHSQIAYYKTGWQLADQEGDYVHHANDCGVEFELADGGEYRIRGYCINPKVDSTVLAFKIHCTFHEYNEKLKCYVYKSTMFNFLRLKYTKVYIFSTKKLSEYQSKLTLQDKIIIQTFREGSEGKWYEHRIFILTFYKRLYR